ncbi:hypothetical protein VTL71DRAFT_1381 [Oculimacula yallundae]|uniref:Uncharacterized protein n=1 Tax=Oculimacula yallundae TaxID=86028 RepID=A0ABR4CBB6_9HELO
MAASTTIFYVQDGGAGDFVVNPPTSSMALSTDRSSAKGPVQRDPRNDCNWNCLAPSFQVQSEASDRSMVI